MADTKISALPVSTTPLAGTEVLPIVQSSTTKQVSVANLTVGRAVSSLSLSTGLATSSGTGAYFNSNLSTETGTPTNQYGLYVNRSSGAAATTTNVYGVRVNTLDYASGKITTNAYGVYIGSLYATNTWGIYQSLSSNSNYFAGNIVIGTAGKGIDFSADAHSAGMTSELLDDYEEGTWTPTQGAGLTVVGTFSASGTYTKVGRLVTVRGLLNGTTTVAAASGTVMCGGLPFNSVSSGLGTASDNSATIGSVLHLSVANLLSVSNIGASTTIHFGATYFV